MLTQRQSLDLQGQVAPAPLLKPNNSSLILDDATEASFSQKLEGGANGLDATLAVAAVRIVGLFELDHAIRHIRHADAMQRDFPQKMDGLGQRRSAKTVWRVFDDV